MFICVAGDVHGLINQFYEEVLAYQKFLGNAYGLPDFDCVLQLGDLGVWPFENHMDRVTKNHEGLGNFQDWIKSNKTAPVRTYFIQGNHEDFDYLYGPSPKLPTGMTWIKPGQVLNINTLEEPLNIAALGGCYSIKDYFHEHHKLQSWRKRHFTKEHIDSLKQAKVDLLLLHDAPRFALAGREKPLHWGPEADGVLGLIRAIKPKYTFFGHHHTYCQINFEDNPVLGLDMIGCPRSLQAINTENLFLPDIWLGLDEIPSFPIMGS